jgi:hypothetical protein
MQRVPVEAPPASSQCKPPRSRRWRWFVLLTLAVAGSIVFMVLTDEMPSVTLSDGTKAIYAGSSNGRREPATPRPSRWDVPLYQHSAPGQDGHRLQRLWQKMRGDLPGWIVSRMPAWDYHEDSYPEGPGLHERELHFRIFGDLGTYAWDIFVADEKGWETQVYDYVWGDDGRFERGAEQHSGWLRLGSAFPLHSKTLRIRFHPGNAIGPDLDYQQRGATFTELVLENPFYEGPTTASGSKLPVTKPFRGGTITLEEIIRDRVVGTDQYKSQERGNLLAVFSLEHAGKPRESYEIISLEVTDSSGQFFHALSSYRDQREVGRYTAGTNTAPWSDDRCWKLRLALCRKDHGTEVDEKEIFRFEKLPVPTDKDVELKRELTRNGITLRLTTLTPYESGVAQISIEGWTEGDPRHRTILIHRVRDDLGDIYEKRSSSNDLVYVAGPVESTRRDVTYAVRLPQGAKWWDLEIIPESITEVEFEVQPPMPQPAGAKR